MRIMILDGNERQALAAVRSLGHAGHDVGVGDAAPRCLAAASRYAREEVTYPSPYDRPGEFLGWARQQLHGGALDALLPMTEVTTDLVLRASGDPAGSPAMALTQRLFAPLATIDAVTDKVALFRRAAALDVPVPRSLVVESTKDLDAAVRAIGFPGIVKPRRSRLWRKTHFLSTAVQRVRDAAALRSVMAAESFGEYPFLYQAQVEGYGQGVFALYDRGRPLAFFAHRRLREKPPDGGVSVLSESCMADPELVRLARRLLDDVGWHGVAMVEFKVSPAGVPYLMEINARFWGSLQLAIDAGVDFPRLLVELAARSVPAAARTRPATPGHAPFGSRRARVGCGWEAAATGAADPASPHAHPHPANAAPLADTPVDLAGMSSAPAPWRDAGPRSAADGATLTPTPVTYRQGRRLRWLLGDLDRLYLVVKAARHRTVTQLLAEFLRFARPDPFRTRHEVFRWRDPWPAAREAAQYLRHLRRRQNARQRRGAPGSRSGRGP